MEIVGISGPCKGHICRLSFAAHSYFSRDIPHHVHGTVIDSQGITKWILNGAWDQFFEASAVISSSAVSQRGLVGSFDNLAHSVQPYTTIWKRADQQLLPDEFVAYLQTLMVHMFLLIIVPPPYTESTISH